MSKISIAIPVYEFGGLGSEILGFSFQKMFTQTLKDFDIVVSDNSLDDKIQDLCDHWSDRLQIHYFRNPKRGAATNSSNAIKMCESNLIKFLCADDYLYDDNSLKTIVENFDDKTTWLFTEYVHTKNRFDFYRHYIPSVNENIIFQNTLGTPSAMAMRNPKLLPDMELFDENLPYSYDSELYMRMLRTFGLPKVVNQVAMVNYVWDGSVTSSMTQEILNDEVKYIMKKYGVSR
jgi:glycosyltransferase involved in cell wall biosynthesis